MNMDSWSARTLLRYILLQLPGWILMLLLLLLLDRWVGPSNWLIAIVFGCWVGKDVIMFPLVWRAYDQNPSRIVYRLLGVHGTAKERLAPSGFVQVHGESWQAEAIPGIAAIEKGERVIIREVRGLTLLVEPLNSGD